jgi:hypothetical protein
MMQGGEGSEVAQPAEKRGKNNAEARNETFHQIPPSKAIALWKAFMTFASVSSVNLCLELELFDAYSVPFSHPGFLLNFARERFVFEVWRRQLGLQAAK